MTHFTVLKCRIARWIKLERVLLDAIEQTFDMRERKSKLNHTDLGGLLLASSRNRQNRYE